MIKFYLQTSPLSSDPDTQIARVIPGEVLYKEDVAKKVVSRGTTVGYTDTIGSLDLMCEVIAEEVAKGNTVILPVAKFRAHIGGSFDDPSANFNKAKNTRVAKITAGDLLVKRMSEASSEKQDRVKRSPDIFKYLDVNTQNSNSLVTPRGVGQLTGTEFKFNPDNEDEGVFYRNSTGVETKVTVFAVRTETRLIFNNPDLPPDTYDIIVRKGYGTKVIDVRSDELDDKLQVP